jgi:nicotinamidase-related amidase
LRAILPTVDRLIDAARANDYLLVFTRQGYRAEMADMTPYQLWRRRRAGLEDTKVLLRGSPGHGIVPEVKVEERDVIIDKTANGAFTHTDLERILRA